MNGDFERVHTMTNYYDGPRNGVADFRGSPHVYASIFDYPQDDYAEEFWLMPISDDVVKLAVEDWQIWRRWEQAFHTGEATAESHPTLPQDRERHEELKRVLADRLTVVPDRSFKARAEFKSGVAHGDTYGLEVRWTPI